MTSSGAHAVPWPALVQFHREVMRRAGEVFCALPVTELSTGRWGSLTGFKPGQLAGPWELEFEALEYPHLQQDVRTDTVETFIGGPYWFRWRADDEQRRHLEWIPLIYRDVRVEERDGRLRIVPVHGGLDACPLVVEFLEQRNIQTAEPLDEMLPDLLSVAESKATEDGHGLTRALVDAFRLVVPESGDLPDHARDDFPSERAAFAPSPWVLFTVSPRDPVIARHTLHDYGLLKRRLAAAPQTRLHHSPRCPGATPTRLIGSLPWTVRAQCETSPPHCRQSLLATSAEPRRAGQ